MNIQEFCFKILSFPWLAKLAEWKFHCSELYQVQTPFPIITLPGGTFFPTTSPVSTTFTFGPTVTTTANPLTTTSTVIEMTTETLLPSTELPTTSSENPISSSPLQETTHESLNLTTTISESPPVLTTTMSMTSLNPQNLTTSQRIEISTLTTTISSISTLPNSQILTTTEKSESTENFPISTQIPINPPILTTTEMPITFSPPVLTTKAMMLTTLPPSTIVISSTPSILTTTTLRSSSSSSSSPMLTTTIPLTTKMIPLTTTMIPLTTSTIPFTTSTNPILTTTLPSTIQSSTIPALTTSTTCPPFPIICPIENGGGSNFGDNNIDPRLTRFKRQSFVNGSQNCLTPESAAGNCVNFRYCNFIVNLIVQYQQKPDDAILNYLKKSVCGQEGNDPMVCCPALVFASLTGTPTAPSTIPPAPFVFSSISTAAPANNSQKPNPPTSNGGGGGGLTFGPISTGSSSQTPQTTTKSPNTAQPPIINQLPTNEVHKCGMVYAIKSRIVGGQTAAPNSYPWLAALGYNITNSTTKISTTQFLCGSTLITQRHLVSAAHCIIPTLLLARLGAFDLTQQPDGVNTIDAYVINIFVHELYDSKKITNDISIIKLDRIIPITTSIRPACIPLGDSVRYKDYAGFMGWIAGWGSTSFGGPASNILQEVQLPIVATADCAFNYKLYFPNLVFDENIICAGYSQGGKDSCQGDSGGGLVMQQLSSDGTYYYYNIIGVVSYGYECARPGFPGIYTRITQYISWIQSKIIL